MGRDPATHSRRADRPQPQPARRENRRRTARTRVELAAAGRRRLPRRGMRVEAEGRRRHDAVVQSAAAAAAGGASRAVVIGARITRAALRSAAEQRSC